MRVMVRQSFDAICYGLFVGLFLKWKWEVN